MSIQALNTADKILVLEGTTNLPSGSRLLAEIQNRDGKTLLRDKGVVRQGGFFFDFDLERLQEFSAYRAVVIFDPENCPLAVRLKTGLWGEALTGSGVQLVDERRIFAKEKEILLSDTARGSDWEGRDFATMEPDELSRLVNSMERYLEQEKEDRATKLALARAYIADEPKELASGSRAHLLLQEVARSPVEDRDGAAARMLLQDIEGAEKQKEARAKTQKALVEGDRYRNDFTITPGRNLGGFRLGMPYRVVDRYFQLSPPLKFDSPEENPTVQLSDFPGVELTFDLYTRRLEAVRTTNPKFKVPEGFGVGSLLQEMQTEFGSDVIDVRDWTFLRQDAGGNQLYSGFVEADGLKLEFRRTVDPIIGIPVDKLHALTVFSSRP